MCLISTLYLSQRKRYQSVTPIRACFLLHCLFAKTTLPVGTYRRRDFRCKSGLGRRLLGTRRSGLTPLVQSAGGGLRQSVLTWRSGSASSLKPPMTSLWSVRGKVRASLREPALPCRMSDAASTLTGLRRRRQCSTKTDGEQITKVSRRFPKRVQHTR